MIDDDEVWDTAHTEDLWIFDKLFLQRNLDINVVQLVVGLLNQKIT